MPLNNLLKTFIKKLLRILFILVVVFPLILFTFQDYFIFPGAVDSLFSSQKNTPQSLPSDIENYFINTADEVRINIWRLGIQNSKYPPLLFFHGNGENVAVTLNWQRWFAERGYTNYVFDYRGYGKSSGWMSEKGLYLDGEAAVDFIAKKENVTPDRIIIVGSSVGTGIAAHTAAVSQSKVVLLLSAYYSLYDAIKEKPFLGLFAPLSRYYIPTAEYLSQLNNSCIILAHGKTDSTISYRNTERIADKINIPAERVLYNPTAGHNDLLWSTEEKISLALKNCLN